MRFYKEFRRRSKLSTTSKYSDAEMNKVMAKAEKELCPQLKYDNSKAPMLKVEQEKQLDCVRIRCPMNDMGKRCSVFARWFTCRRQIEP